MAYNKRKEKRKKKKKFQLILIAVIFIYLIFRSVPSLLANSAKVILPEKDILINKKTVEAVIIKKEESFKATGSGKLELFSNEGDRVSSGAKVASISMIEDSSDLKEKLKKIENSIVVLEKPEADNNPIEDIEKKLKDDLEKLISEGEYDQIYLLKEKLNSYNSKESKDKNIEELIKESLEELKLRKESVVNEINSNIINYYTNTGGIISYEMDGYEEKYTPKDFENYSYDKLSLGNVKINDAKLKSKIVVDEPIYKIIDNFEWYMGIKIENIEEIDSYKNGDLAIIEMIENEEEIVGRIVSINNSKNNSVIIVKFNTKLHDYYNERFPRINLIKDKIEGYKIPSKAIIEKDSLEGVYIKDASGIVRFRPVIILAEKEKNVYVHMGDRNSNIEITKGKKLVKTISIHDEIFINTRNIKEGQIIN